MNLKNIIRMQKPLKGLLLTTSISFAMTPAAFAQSACTPDATVGNDTITCTGDTGFLRLRADEGDDTINVDNANTRRTNFVVEGNEGNDTINVTNSFLEDIYGDNFSSSDDGGNDIITIAGSTIRDRVDLSGGNNRLTVTDSSIGGQIRSRLGNNVISLTRVTDVSSIFLDDGDDMVTLVNSEVRGNVDLQDGTNTLTATDSIINGQIRGGDGINTISLTRVTDLNSITVGENNDVITLVDTDISGSVFLDDGNDSFTATGGRINGSISSRGTGNDTVSLTNVADINSINITDGADTVILDNTQLSGSLNIGRNSDLDGDDSVTLRNNAAIGSLAVGEGNDTIVSTMSEIRGSVSLGDGNDSLTATDGIINGSISSTDGDDTVILTNVVDVNNINISRGADTVILDNTVLSGQLDVGVNGDTDGADNVTLRNNSDVGTSIDLGSQDDVLTASDSRINGSIFSSDGDDTVSLTNVVDVNSINIAEGADTVLLDNTILSGTLDVGLNNDDDGVDTVSVLNGSVVGGRLDTGFGDDNVIITNSEIGGTVTLGDGNDTIVANNAIIDQRIEAGDGNDMITVLNSDNTDLNFFVEGEGDDDVIIITNSTLDTVLGDVNRTETTRDGDDTITITNSTIEREIRTTGGDDVLTLSNVMVLNNGSTSGISVDLGSGEDVVDFTGTINGSLNLGADNDTLVLTAASIINSTSSSDVFGGSGDDVITVNGGTFNRGIDGGNDNDTLTLNAGTLGELSAGSGNDAINLYGGTLTGANSANRFNAGSGDDTLIADPTQSAAALNLLGISVFDGDAGTDTATFRNIATGNQLVDNVAFTQWETVTFENSIVNIDDSNFTENVTLVNSTLNQVDGDLNLSGGSTILSADSSSRVNLQDGVVDDSIWAQYNASAGSTLAVDVDVTARGFQQNDSDYIVGSVHTPEAGAIVNVNLLGIANLSGSRRIVDGGADVTDPGVGAVANASSTYVLQNDPSTGARRFWLEDGEDGGVYLVWTTPVSPLTTAAVLGGAASGAAIGPDGKIDLSDPNLVVDPDAPGAGLAPMAAGQAASFIADSINGAVNSAAAGSGRGNNANNAKAFECAAGSNGFNVWGTAGVETGDYGQNEMDSSRAVIGAEKDVSNVLNTACGRIKLGTFFYATNNEIDQPVMGSNNEANAYGAGLYVKAETKSNVYASLMGYIGQTDYDGLNAVLESRFGYDSQDWGVRLDAGKVFPISKGDMTADVRGYVGLSNSSANSFTDSGDFETTSIDDENLSYGASVGLAKPFENNQRIYGRLGVDISNIDSELVAYDIPVNSAPSYTLGRAELGYENTTADGNGTLRIGINGRKGDEVEAYGASITGIVRF